MSIWPDWFWPRKQPEPMTFEEREYFRKLKNEKRHDELLALDSATPNQIERANAAVTPNLNDDGQPKYESAFGYACALTAIMQTDAAALRAKAANQA